MEGGNHNSNLQEKKQRRPSLLPTGVCHTHSMQGTKNVGQKGLNIISQQMTWLAPQLHGFTIRKSTTTNLCEWGFRRLAEPISHNIPNNIVFLYHATGLWHSFTPERKIESHRIEGQVVAWIEQFLTDRRQCVMVNFTSFQKSQFWPEFYKEQCLAIFSSASSVACLTRSPVSSQSWLLIPKYTPT